MIIEIATVVFEEDVADKKLALVKREEDVTVGETVSKGSTVSEGTDIDLFCFFFIARNFIAL